MKTRKLGMVLFGVVLIASAVALTSILLRVQGELDLGAMATDAGLVASPSVFWLSAGISAVVTCVWVVFAIALGVLFELWDSTPSTTTTKN